jgi:DNA-binding transcriptional ArsR family regulator
MYDFIYIAKALSDENRVRALMLLSQGELCVCQLIEMLRLAPSTVSKHMSILRQARLVEGRKEGRWMYYRLADEDPPKEAIQAIGWVQNSLAKDKQILADNKQLKLVCKIDKEELCGCYERTKSGNDNSSVPKMK